MLLLLQILKKGLMLWQLLIENYFTFSWIEIVSPDNPTDDYIRKLYYYKNYGVREYWIVDPRRKASTVNYFEGDHKRSVFF